MNKKPLILLVGESGSGKTSVGEYLETFYNMPMLNSYTTRKPRSENEKGHIFISTNEYLKLKDKIATTYFHGNYYCATKEQCETADIYIIDPHGVKTFDRNYKGDRDYMIVFLKTSIFTRAYRMIKRGDGFKQIVSRLWHDYNEFYGFVENRNNVHIIKCDNLTIPKTAFMVYRQRFDYIMEKYTDYNNFDDTVSND